MSNAESQPGARNTMTDTHPPVSELVLSEVAAFVQTVARLLASQSDYTVARLTTIIGKYVAWAHGIRGLPLAERLLFDTKVVDLYIRDSRIQGKLHPSSIGTYRSVLLRVSEVLLPRDEATQARGLSANALLPPYSAEELTHFPTWALGQRTDLMGQKATALMCLGLGCGLRAREINTLRREDIEDDNGIIVTVLDENGARRVPMLPRYEPAFRKLIESRRSGDFIFGKPEREVRRNAISEFVAVSNCHRVKPNTYRMRTTWIVGRLASGVDLPTLLEAAGLDRLEKLGDYIPYLAQPTPATFAGLTKDVVR
ncbi:site-specific integrase [Protaetiibacter intestinalis]|uniref:Uncharacterized protein n=1 Tax=Protaetiibacter intestinalis TaxID=2419774 RepID=A0A387B149_9MICO|nr:tyrosine-type recombinase/integrase [Protaetiibacter intestinalis]AYF97232.1 hypothetical protein D7I47_02520 [Protaetiibacter intestinalis]